MSMRKKDGELTDQRLVQWFEDSRPSMPAGIAAWKPTAATLCLLVFGDIVSFTLLTVEENKIVGTGPRVVATRASSLVSPLTHRT